ncbi:hypothetical protein ACI79J_03530 [Geodermatophilus sp. SYSU D01062]
MRGPARREFCLVLLRRMADLRWEVLCPGGSVLHEHLVRARAPRSRRRPTGGCGCGSTWWPT